MFQFWPFKRGEVCGLFQFGGMTRGMWVGQSTVLQTKYCFRIGWWPAWSCSRSSKAKFTRSSRQSVRCGFGLLLFLSSLVEDAQQSRRVECLVVIFQSRCCFFHVDDTCSEAKSSVLLCSSIEVGATREVFGRWSLLILSAGNFPKILTLPQGQGSEEYSEWRTWTYSIITFLRAERIVGKPRSVCPANKELERDFFDPLR
jgi:hypothetical protein